MSASKSKIYQHRAKKPVKRVGFNREEMRRLNEVAGTGQGFNTYRQQITMAVRAGAMRRRNMEKGIVS